MFELRLENKAGNIVNINDGNRYVVLSCTGLNPPSASIFTAKSPNRKGSKHKGSSLDERPMILTIKLLGDIEENPFIPDAEGVEASKIELIKKHVKAVCAGR